MTPELWAQINSLALRIVYATTHYCIYIDQDKLLKKQVVALLREAGLKVKIVTLEETYKLIAH